MANKVAKNQKKSRFSWLDFLIYVSGFVVLETLIDFSVDLIRDGVLVNDSYAAALIMGWFVLGVLAMWGGMRLDGHHRATTK